MHANRPSRFAAFTLLEVLLVIVIMGVLAGMLVPDNNANAVNRLESAASVLGQELEYARSLAVANADRYKVTFDLANNRFILTHSGANAALDTLPITSFHRVSDPPGQQIINLNELPTLGSRVRLYAVWSLANPPQSVSDVEFTPLGGTTRPQATLVWLVTQSGNQTRYLSVRVHPVTGLFWIENFRATAPAPAEFAGS